MAHLSKACDEELLLPPPSEQMENEDAEPKKPKLTMKFLSERIQELQRENDGLAARLEALEKKSSDDRIWNKEVAAAQSPFFVGDDRPKLGAAPPLKDLIREVSAVENRHPDTWLSQTGTGMPPLGVVDERTGFPRSALIPRSEKYPSRPKKRRSWFRFLTRFW